MRLAVCVLTCVAATVVTPVFADPEASAPAATPATPASATPAAPAAAAHPATPAAADKANVEIDAAKMDQLEKHFLSEGYKIEMHNGEKYFCRREEQLGSRLGGQKQCQTAQQLKWTEDDARRAAEHGQQNQGMGPKQ
jgi:hypothetical protein